MKHLFFLSLLISLSYTFSSCSDDDDNGFNLECTGKQIMREGVIQSLSIKGGTGNYIIKSSDESIATLEEQISSLDKSIYYNIIAHSKGEVTFTAYGEDMQKSITLAVVDPYMAHGVLSIDANTKQDSGKSPLTKEQVEAEGLFTLSNTFIMQKNEAKSFYMYKSKDEHLDGKHYIAKGTFKFGKIDNDNSIEIKIDNEAYLFRITGGKSSSVQSFYQFFRPEWLSTKALDSDYYENIVLTQDVTQRIQNKYPDSGITEATIDYKVSFLDVNLFLAPEE